MRTGTDLRKIKDGSGLDAEQTLELAERGELNPRAIAMVELMQHAMRLEAMSKAGKIEKRLLKWVPHHQKVWAVFKAEFFTACQKHSGSLLRDMADAMEQDGPANPVAAFVGTQLLSRQIFNQPIPTKSEMLRLVREQGLQSNLPTIGRYYELVEVNPPKGRPGAPRGKRKFKTSSPVIRARK